MSDDSQSELSSAPSDIPSDDALLSTTATSIQETVQESAVRAVATFETNGRSKKRKAEEASASAKRTRRVKKGPQSVYKEEEEEVEEAQEVVTTTPKKRARGGKGSARAAVIQETEVKVKTQESVEVLANGTAEKPKRKRKVKTETVVDTGVRGEEQEAENGTVVKKVKRKRKTKEEKEAEAMPLAARTVGSRILVGAHVSSAGGVHNAVTNSVHIGGNAFALFLKSQRKWANPPLDPTHTTLFRTHCSTHAIDSTASILPHGSYLVNLAHTDAPRAAQAYEAFVDDLRRCKKLGIRLYNFHPGNCASSSREEGIRQLAKQLNRAHEDQGTGEVVTVLETMAATGGNTLGSSFEDLRAIIDLVERKDRVGVCLDTCHVHAAGYDLRTPQAFGETMERFEEVVGFRYLRALHVNDSKAPFASGRDLHANIGTGFLGLRAFHNVVNEPRLWGLPMVLETPIDVKNAEGKVEQDKGIWAREIKLLESLVGMDVEGEEFKGLERELAEMGEVERKKHQEQFERKMEKKREKEEVKKKGRKKRKAKGSNPSSAESSSESSEEDR